MSHNKRQTMPKNWPIARKGNVYFISSSHAKSAGIPILVALRDILKIVATAKEARMILLKGEVLVNQKVRKDPGFPIQTFDVLELAKINKNYRLEVSGKKIKFVEVTEKIGSRKNSKIVGKVLIDKKNVQMNLEDGTNLLTAEKFSVGDTAVISLKENKLEKIVPLKEGATVFIVSGRHSGKKGKVVKNVSSPKKREYLIKFENSESVLPLKTLLATE